MNLFENASTLLGFADKQSCALWKEAATNLMIEDMDFVRKSKGWSMRPVGLLKNWSLGSTAVLVHCDL